MFIANSVGKVWYEHADLDSPELRAMATLMKPTGASILECGGHHGRDSVLLAMMVGENGSVSVFEPNPENVEVIKKNVELNSLKNVEVFHSAVGAEEGVAHTFPRSNAKISRCGIEVRMTTIDR